MFRLLRLIVVLGALGVMVWFGATVPLGERTFFEHVQAIWKTQESRELLRGTKERVGGAVDRAADKVVKTVSKSSPTQVNTREGAAIDEPAKPPMEELQEKDRNALRGLIGKGLQKE